MNTFLPYISYRNCAACLDYQRLGKQRVEAYQILNIIEGYKTTNGWRNHPAVIMWRLYPYSLREYYNAMLDEWIRRGYKNDMPHLEVKGSPGIPFFVYDRRLRQSHRCNLMRKNSEYYGRFGWSGIDVNAPYWWPTGLKNKRMNKIMIDYWESNYGNRYFNTYLW